MNTLLKIALASLLLPGVALAQPPFQLHTSPSPFDGYTPPDRAVRIEILREAVTGDTLPASALLTILFVEEPCPLKIEGAAGMRRAWQNTALYQLGCWYPTRDQTWVFVGQEDFLDRNDRMYWEAYPRALLHADGSATITEPHYDAGFRNRIIVKHFAEAHARMYGGVKDRP
jgi:hypothetical protein